MNHTHNHYGWVGALALSLSSLVVSAQSLRVEVTNPTSSVRVGEPVEVALAKGAKSGVVVRRSVVGNRPETYDEVPSQVVDGRLLFVTDVDPHATETFTVEMTPDVAQRQYPERVHAHLKLWDRKYRYPRVNEVEFQGDVPSLAMYDAIYGHGAMWESEYVGFRIYMDHRQSLDLYGKQHPQMELDSTNFYSTPALMQNGFGEDILFAGQSVAAGSFRGLRNGRPCYIDTVAARRQRVVESGPVRTIVEMEDRDWVHNGRVLQMRQRYTMLAGHRDVQVDIYLEGCTDDEQFVTGVQKLEMDNEGLLSTLSDGSALVGSWGRNVPDKANPALIEGVGLGVYVPSAYVSAVEEDELNYLVRIHPMDGHIRYHIAAYALMQQDGPCQQASQWFGLLQQWPAALTTPCHVRSKRSKK